MWVLGAMQRTIETIGIFAVVVSILFVGYELQENADATKASNHSSLVEMNLATNEMIIADAELSEIAEKMFAGRENELDDSERLRAELIKENYFAVWEAAFYNNESGQLDPDIWHAWDTYYQSVFGPISHEYWENKRDQYGSRFQRHVDEALGRGA